MLSPQSLFLQVHSSRRNRTEEVWVPHGTPSTLSQDPTGAPALEVELCPQSSPQPVLVPLNNTHPRAGSGIPNPTFGCWVTHTVPSSPWWCHWHTAPSSCSRELIKDLWVQQPTQKKDLLPWEGGGLSLSSQGMDPFFSAPFLQRREGPGPITQAQG